MPEISPSDLKPRESNVIERRFYDAQYAMTALAKSTKGITSLQNPHQALIDIGIVRERLNALEAACQEQADIKNAEKAAAAAIRLEAEKAARAEAQREARNAARRAARLASKGSVEPPMPVIPAIIVIDEPVLPSEPVATTTIVKPTFKKMLASLKSRIAA